jgi:Family of unknown function (DUF5995)
LSVTANVGAQRRNGAGPGRHGLDGVLRALAAVHPDEGGAPTVLWCGAWMCRAVVGEVRARNADVVAADAGRDAEFEEVLVRRLAERHLRTVADHAAGAPVPLVWELLLDASPAPPPRLALAAGRALRDHDLALAFVGAATVLGRTPGPAECDGHQRVAALLGRCVRELAGRAGDPGAAAVARFDDPAARRAAWQRAAHLWTLRGRPAEAENARRTLDREVRAEVARLLFAG